MSDSVSISVAMTTYNGSRFVAKQIQSILDQTVAVSEIVVSDDGSTDGTLEILDGFAAKDPRFTILRSERNLGYCRNFEKALSYCRGAFVALSDQDDVWEPNKLEVLLAEIGEKSLACSDAMLIDDQDRPIHDSYREYTSLIVDPKSKEGVLFHFFVTGCTVLLRAELLRKAMPFPEGIHYHDYWLAIVASHDRGIVYVPRPLVRYRQHTANQIGAAKAVSFEAIVSRFSRKSQVASRTYWAMRISMFRAALNAPILKLESHETAALRDAINYFRVFCAHRPMMLRFDLLIRRRSYFAPGVRRLAQELSRYTLMLLFYLLPSISKRNPARSG